MSFFEKIFNNANKNSNIKENYCNYDFRLYDDSVSEDEFNLIVSRVGKGIPRLLELKASGLSVYGVVESMTGLSNWAFRIDFKGIDEYIIDSEVEESHIPNVVAKRINDALKKLDVYEKNGYEFRYSKEKETYTDPFEDPEFAAKIESLHAESVRKKAEAQKKAADAARIRIENERIEKERKKIKRKKHIKTIICIAIVFTLLGGIFDMCVKIRQRTTVPFSAEEIVGENKDDVIVKLDRAGFKNIYPKSLGDLRAYEVNKENTVENVCFGDEYEFNSDTKFSNEIQVTISYHTFKNIFVPIDNKEAKKKKYEDVAEMFKTAGFDNIQTEADYDLSKLLGKRKYNMVKKIYINGNEDFENGAMYSADCKVKIVYHTYKGEKE